MKSIVKRLVSRAVRNDRVWSWLDATLLQFARFAEWERQKNLPDPLEAPRLQFINAQLADLTVRHGPFQGLRFPQAHAATGSLLPKLIGSYECELHSVMRTIDSVPYTQILNIGSGEGYYAVGLALRHPTAAIVAWDTSEQARAECLALAELNGVADRLQCLASCSPQTLLEFPFQGRSLILSDCEGYEKQLFTAATARALKEHDVLIEVHDFVDMDVSTELKRAMASTHHLQIIPSIGDIQRVHMCDYPELADVPKEQRKHLLSEDRHQDMEWFWFTAKR